MAGVKGQPGTKPSQLPAGPAAQQQDIFEAALNAKPAELPAATQSGGQDPFDSALAQESQPAEGQGNPLMPSAGDIASGVMRGLNVAGGLTRAGLAMLEGMGAQVAQGQNPLSPDTQPIVTPKDVKNAALGKGPGWAEYLRRMGVDEGGSYNVPGLGKVTLRGAGGLALDVLTDPLTSLARAAKASPFLNKIINAPGAASDALGEAIYKSAYPTQEIGQAMLEGVPEAGLEGATSIVATQKQVAQKILDQSSVMGKLRQGLYDKAEELGARVNAADLDFSRAQSVIDKMRRNNNLAPLADAAEEMLNNFRAHGEVPLAQASEWKSELYSQLPKSFFQGNGRLMNLGKEFKGALAGDFREAIVDAGNAGAKGLGDAVEALNSKWGALLDAVPQAGKAVAKPAQSKLGHLIDGAVLAVGGLKPFAIKKGYDLATSPLAKTVVGNALMKAGQEGLATGLTNQAAQQYLGNKPESPPEGQ